MSHSFIRLSLVGCALLLATAHAERISGTISGTKTITEDSVLAGDVNCTVASGPCIVINAPMVTLDLNGHTMTGQGDPQTGCSGGATANEFGILVNSQLGVTIHGPGVVQRFRNTGIQILTSTGTMVTAVTTATNCASGILVAGGAANEISENISIANGNGSSACGGI